MIAASSKSHQCLPLVLFSFFRRKHGTLQPQITTQRSHTELELKLPALTVHGLIFKLLPIKPGETVVNKAQDELSFHGKAPTDI